MPVSLEELKEAFDFVSLEAGLGENGAVLCRRTGKIFWRSDVVDLDELGELPDDIEDETKYLEIPNQRDLDLGQSLVFNFVSEFLPADYDEVRRIFKKKGAYGRFKDLLERRHALDRWYAFEAAATERALREWCEVNSIELVP